MYFNNIFELLLIINYYCCGAVYGNHFFNVSDTHILFVNICYNKYFIIQTMF